MNLWTWTAEWRRLLASYCDMIALVLQRSPRSFVPPSWTRITITTTTPAVDGARKTYIMRTGNTELLRSFYVSQLGVLSLMMAIWAKDHVYDYDWRGLAAIACFFLLSACAAYLTMRHYQKVEAFKNQRYATFLLKGAIVLSAVAFIVGAVPLLSHV